LARARYDRFVPTITSPKITSPTITWKGPAMTIDKATAARVAHLARIRVEDADLEPLAADLGRILDFMEQLNEVNVDGVEPMTAVTPMALRRRADEVTDGGIRDKILANAPDARDGFFTVPKVVE
jgi:aspartyl-tRNA(Asn)/glutamyl-tRNA(Gln) amidotransferase subunit C